MRAVELFEELLGDVWFSAYGLKKRMSLYNGVINHRWNILYEIGGLGLLFVTVLLFWFFL